MRNITVNNRTVKIGEKSSRESFPHIRDGMTESKLYLRIKLNNGKKELKLLTKRCV